MKAQNLFFALGIFLALALSLSFISASYNVTYNVYSAVWENSTFLNKSTQPLSGFNYLGYICTSNNCSTIENTPVEGLTGSSSGSNATLIFPEIRTPSAVAHGYVIYFYKEGYIGWQIINESAWGNGSAMGDNVYLSQKRTGNLSLDNFNVNTTTKQVNVLVNSAINSRNLSAINTSLYEQVNATLKLEILNSSGAVVYNTSKSLMIPYSGSKEIAFDYPSFNSGNYTFNLTASLDNENKIIGKVPVFLSQNTTLTDTLAPTITNITSIPVMPFINNGTSQNLSINFSSDEYPLGILFNLYNSTSLVNTQSKIIANSSELPVSYVVPVNLSNGIYFLNMTVNDSAGNSRTYIIGNFSVNKTSPPIVVHDDDDEEDLLEIPIGPYTVNMNKDIIDVNSTSNSSGVISLNPQNSDSGFDYRLFLYWFILVNLFLILIILVVCIIRAL